jgi:hypothetical protein
MRGVIVTKKLGVAAGLMIAVAAAALEPPTQRERNRAWVATNDQQAVQAYARDTNLLVRPGLLAHRTERWVRLWAEATALAGDTPIEFFLIAENSGHDYETVAVSFAQPSDVHAALEFIGVKPGHPVDADRLRFWPRGERVHLTFEWSAGNVPQRARAEELIVDKRTGRPLPRKGLVFTGSYPLPSSVAGRGAGYAADERGPNAIAANYNEPTIVLDVPWQAGQSEVYGRQIANPAWVFTTGQLVQVTLAPEYRDGRARVRPLTLSVEPPTGATNAAPAGPRYRLADEATGRPLAAKDDAPALLAAMERIASAGQDPYVTVRFADALPLTAVRAACQFIASIEGENGIRIESPPAGHPYYRAFLPNESFRTRTERPSQPWELHLTNAAPDGAGLGYLTQLEAEWTETNEAPVVTARDIPVATVADLRAQLARRQEVGMRVVLIYAPASLRYGAVRAVIAALIDTHPTVYVFLE